MTEQPKIGRPTGYKPEYCEAARTFLADGYSVAAFAGSIGVAKSSVYLWMESHPEFSDAVKAGQAGAVLWWEDRLRTIAKDGGGNATAAIFGLKNRAPEEWRDKTEVEATHGVTDPVADLLASIASAGKRVTDGG